MKWLILLLLVSSAAAQTGQSEIQHVLEVDAHKFHVYAVPEPGGVTEPETSQAFGCTSDASIDDMVREPFGARVEPMPNGGLRFKDLTGERTCAQARLNFSLPLGYEALTPSYYSNRIIHGSAGFASHEQYVEIRPADAPAQIVPHVFNSWQESDDGEEVMEKSDHDPTLLDAEWRGRGTIILGIQEIFPTGDVPRQTAFADGLALTAEAIDLRIIASGANTVGIASSDKILRSDGGEVLYQKTLAVDLYSIGEWKPQAIIALPEGGTIESVRGPLGNMPSNILNVTQGMLILDKGVISQYGYGTWTVLVHYKQPLDNAGALTTVLGALFLIPAGAGVYAQRSVYAFEVVTRGTQRLNYWMMQGALVLAWLAFLAVLFALIFGGLYPIMWGESLQPKALMLYAILFFVTVIFFVAMPVAKKGELMAVHMKLSERERMEKKLAMSNQDLAQFASVASHDMREPLRMVSSFSALLQRKYKNSFDDQGEQYLEYINDGVVRLEQLLDGLLAYARLDRDNPKFKPADLNVLMTQVNRDLTVLANETGATITWKDMPTVDGVPSQLSQLLRNLITNSLRYRSEEPPKVEVRGLRKANAWHIEVKDNGIGIEPRHHDLVFQIFHRLDRRREDSGTGLGLALCRRIVERHGGKIGIESELGKGCTVWFTIPDTPADYAPQPES